MPPIVYGAALCLYKQGSFCNEDTFGGGSGDLDMAGGIPPMHFTPPSLCPFMPAEFEQQEKLYGTNFNLYMVSFGRYGTCECLLPGHHRFACPSDMRRFAEELYGASWWVPKLSTKSSLLPACPSV